jgi:hypothetical protein
LVQQAETEERQRKKRQYTQSIQKTKKMAPEEKKQGFRPVGLEFLLSEESMIAEKHLPREHAEVIGDALAANVSAFNAEMINPEESKRAPMVSFVLDGLKENTPSYSATIHYNLAAFPKMGKERSDKINHSAALGAEVITAFTKELGYSGFVSDHSSQNLNRIITEVLKSNDSSFRPEEVVLRFIAHNFGVYVEIGTQSSLNSKSESKSVNLKLRDIHNPDYECPRNIRSAKMNFPSDGTYAEGSRPDDKGSVLYMLKLLSANIQVSGKYAAEEKWNLAGKVMMDFLDKYDNWMQSPDTVLTRDTYSMMHQLRDELFNLTSNYTSLDCAKGTAINREDKASIANYTKYQEEQDSEITSSGIGVLMLVKDICDRLRIDGNSIPLLKKERMMDVGAGAIKLQHQDKPYQ